MKKIVLALCSIFLLISCDQNEDLNTIPDQNDIEVLDDYSDKPEYFEGNSTKSMMGGVKTCTAIDQIVGLEVNILAQGVNNHKYLSVNDRRNTVELLDKDTDSGREKWIIRKMSGGLSDAYQIQCVGSSRKGNWLFINNSASDPGGRPAMWENRFGAFSILPVNNNSESLFTIGVDIGNINYYMGATSYDSRTLKNEIKNDLGRQNWNIVPTGEFEVIDISYKITPSDHLSMRTMHSNRVTIENVHDYPYKSIYTFNESVTNSSKFEKTNGVSVTLKAGASFKTGIPRILEGGLSTELTTATTYSYETGETTEWKRTVTEVIEKELPARSYYTMELIGTEYTASATYTAKVKRVGSEDIAYLTGKWKGVIVSDLKIRMYDPNEKLIETIKVSPSNIKDSDERRSDDGSGRRPGASGGRDRDKTETGSERENSGGTRPSYNGDINGPDNSSGRNTASSR